MPCPPHHSLLRVDLPAFHAIDSTSVEDLFGMWSVFSKTSHAMPNGRRYENMSWRLMNRETFCNAPASKPRSAPATCSTAANAAASSADSLTIPALSSSLESSSSSSDDDDALSFPSHSRSELRPSYTRGESTESYRVRPREKHMAPVDLGRIVSTIQQSGLQPIHLTLPGTSGRSHARMSLAQSPALPSASKTAESPQVARSSSQSTIMESSASTLGSASATKSSLMDSRIQLRDSQASSNTEASTHSIIRGFVAGGAPSSYRSQTHLPTQPTPILKSANRAPSAAKKKGAMFTIGTSSGEEESSLDSHMHSSAVVDCMKRPAGSSSTATKKQTSFKDEIEIGRAARDSPVFDDSDDSDEEISESAIEDDDDSSDWEDSDDGSGPSSMFERELFQRVDSRPNLASRRSLLTSALHEPERAQALADAASRSTPALHRSRKPTPNDPSLAASPTTTTDGGMQWAGQGPSLARPIIRTTSNIQGPMALSPRTTRRNMLSTELTESLRKNLLWERQHRSTGNLAALKRRHTSHDVKNLRQHPEPGPVLSQGDPAQFNNDFFNAGLGEYHTKGW